LQAAMIPPTGTITLSFMGIPITPFPFNFVDSSVIERALETHPLLTNVRVGVSGTCWDLKVNIEFLSSGGDQPLLEVVDTSDIAENNAVVTVQGVTDGYLRLCPIPGDMLAKVEKDPQIRVYVNDIPTVCGRPCTHTVDNSLNPSITEASVTGSSSYSLVVTGVGFDANSPEANILQWLGPENEVVETANALTASETQLGFYSQTLEQFQAGTQNARILVKSSGVSEVYSVDLGTASATINSITPNTGALGGGIIVEISGSRFDPYNPKVYIDDALCPVLFASKTIIQCTVPESTTDGDKPVTVVQLGITISNSIIFTYDASITPEIVSAQPSTNIPLAGQNGWYTGSQVCTMQAQTKSEGACDHPLDPG
uniref:IPT/TIG domain-containing protein n=1 Tax=Echinostoma caproni TaxID=27848 RepID=A0A183AY48_9TREM